MLIGKHHVANKIYDALLAKVSEKISFSDEKLKKDREIATSILQFLVSALGVN
ncbi:MAG: hypothetical protein ACTS77_01010 [Arsenophonus sp. NC-TX2-MAG3]